jgi:uncharacterized BrkB/YihY/UPF0761 family membrane protein
MLRELWRKFDRDWGWNLARLLAYTCLMAHFAVLILALSTLWLVLRLFGLRAGRTLVAPLFRLLPDQISSTAAMSAAGSLRHASPLLIIPGVLVAIWYGSRFFVTMESCLCVMFRRPPRPFLRQNRAAMLLLALFAVVLPILVLSSTLVPFGGFAALFPQTSPTAMQLRLAGGPLLVALGILLSLTANALLLLVALTRLTPGGVPLRLAAPGALLGAALTQGYLLIFPVYVEGVLHPSRFGEIAGFVLVALVFIYAYALFIVIGAELTSWLAGYRARDQDVTTLLAGEHALRHTHAAGREGSSGGERGLGHGHGHGHGHGGTPTPTPSTLTPSSPTSSAQTPAPPEASFPWLGKGGWRRLVDAGAAAVRHRNGNGTRNGNGNGRTPQSPRGTGPAAGAS